MILRIVKTQEVASYQHTMETGNSRRKNYRSFFCAQFFIALKTKKYCHKMCYTLIRVIYSHKAYVIISLKLQRSVIILKQIYKYDVDGGTESLLAISIFNLEGQRNRPTFSPSQF